MKSTEILFWAVMVCIAIFYITTGNEMHEKRAEVMKVKQMEQNSTK